MKKLGFIILLELGSLVAQAQAPNAAVVALQIELQGAQQQIKSLSASLADALIENSKLKEELAKAKASEKVIEKPSN